MFSFGFCAFSSATCYIHTHTRAEIVCGCVCAGSLICIPTNCSIVAIVVRDKNLWGSRSTCFVYAQQRPPRDECLAPHYTHTPHTHHPHPHPPLGVVCTDLPNKYVYCFYINFVKINNNKNSCKSSSRKSKSLYLSTSSRVLGGYAINTKL